MKNIILFDSLAVKQNLLPLTFTRPIAEIRVGITTIRQKWEAQLAGEYSHLTEPHLAALYPARVSEDNLFVAAHLLPSPSLLALIEGLNGGEALVAEGEVIAFRGTMEGWQTQHFVRTITLETLPCMIKMPYDIFMKNGEVLESDFRRITAGRTSAPLSESNRVVGNPYFEDGTPKLFIEEGARVECAILNLDKGAIYIGKDAEIMEGVAIRAPFAACEHATVNMGSKVYGATTLGPFCKVGGELNNVVMLGYANKAHDGFLGNAVIGEWCNLGAGCTASNLKNDYSEIKLWHYPTRCFQRTGLQFCGLIMGDHSKAGINTMFNTATVVGVAANIYGSGFPRNVVSSFTEGSTAGFAPISLKKFFTVADRVMARRGKCMGEAERALYAYLKEQEEI